MEIDFHFGVTYVVSRIAGLNHDQAQIVATCSQYVDDTVKTGILKFETGEAYHRISTAHKRSDYHIFLPAEERKVWVPFHFLPGNESNGSHEIEFYNRIVCRPNSLIAQQMAKNCILKQERHFGLHQLGITAHVFIDTWAHQGFAGIDHPVNIVTDIKLQDSPLQNNFLKAVMHAGLFPALWQLVQPTFCKLLNRFFPMGHGAALHHPDHPFKKWSYKNGQGELVIRDNPKDFLEASDELCKLIRRFILKDPDAIVEGLPPRDRELIAKKINELKDEDGWVRNEIWKKGVRDGEFSFGAANPQYLGTGLGSWKSQALGITFGEMNVSQTLTFEAKFLTSNWKLFHDAAKAHQFEVLTEILPSFGICAI
jgi:hypothetical protein